MSTGTPQPPARQSKLPPDCLQQFHNYAVRRAKIGLGLTLSGLFIFLIGIRPGLLGLDRSPVIGFVQIGVFLFGIALICLGGYISLKGLWKKQKLSIAADFGTRLIATGLLVTIFSGMADILGFGSHRLSSIPYFGPLQSRGVELGQVIIGIGFVLMLPFFHNPNPATAHPPHESIQEKYQ